MRVYGYIRKEYPNELIKQLNAVQQYECDEISVEEADLRVTDELTKIIDTKLVLGDTFIVPDIKVLGKNFKNIIPAIQFFKDKEIRFISVADKIDTSHNHYSFYDIVILLGEMDDANHLHLTNLNLKPPKVQGNKSNHPRVSNAQVNKIIRLHGEGKTFREICDICSVSIGTVHKYIKEFTES